MTEKKAVSAEVPKETPVLKAVHLGISFGGLKAVDDFNMEIGRSERSRKDDCIQPSDGCL